MLLLQLLLSPLLLGTYLNCSVVTLLPLLLSLLLLFPQPNDNSPTLTAAMATNFGCMPHNTSMLQMPMELATRKHTHLPSFAFLATGVCPVNYLLAVSCYLVLCLSIDALLHFTRFH